VFSKKKRSEVMSHVRSKNTTPEKLIMDRIDGRFLRYQPRGLVGKPDFANKKRRIVVFIDGCFWHGCPNCYREPKSNLDYWIPKVKQNKNRDQTITDELSKQGYNVFRFWECDVKKNPDKVAKRLMEAVLNA
jgi:DNA mismatch endonuclease (patch repair protein)